MLVGSRTLVGWMVAALFVVGGCIPNGGGGSGGTTSSGGSNTGGDTGGNNTGGSNTGGGPTGGNNTGGNNTGGSNTGGNNTGGGHTGGGHTGGSNTGGSTGGTGGSTTSSSTSSTTTFSCSPVYQGSFTALNAQDLAMIAPYCEITGDLTLNAPGIATISLPNLQKVDGKITTVATPTVLDLPVLQSSGPMSTSAMSYTLPMLQTLTGGVSEITCTGTLKLPALVTADALKLHPMLSVDLPELVTVASELTVSSPSGSSVHFWAPKLTSSGSLAVILGASFEASSLTTVTNALQVQDYYQLTYNLPALVSVGRMEVISGGQLKAPNLVTVGGIAESDLILRGPFLIDLAKLQTVGRTLWVAGTAVPSLDLPSLTSVGDSIRLGGASAAMDACQGGAGAAANSQLNNLFAPMLGHVGGAQNNGALQLGANPKLPQCEWDALVAQLQASGWTGQVITNPALCPLTAGPCN